MKILNNVNIVQISFVSSVPSKDNHPTPSHMGSVSELVLTNIIVTASNCWLTIIIESKVVNKIFICEHYLYLGQHDNSMVCHCKKQYLTCMHELYL